MSEESDPINEAYLGRESVYHFDQMIILAMELNDAVARWTRGKELSRLQKASCQLIPHGFSIALGIRELVGTGYLFSAEILVRPLIERAGVLSYLIESTGDVVGLWEQGWPYKTRPSLKQLMAAMRDSVGEEIDLENEKLLVGHFNRLIHADPLGSSRNIGSAADGVSGFLAGPNLSAPEICDDICLLTTVGLLVLHARATQVFQEATSDLNIQGAREIAAIVAAQKPK
ncbi:MAG: hypothetical protein IH996_07775 [Proteobacteria bacterium]|nr:hypothetical protein [Pseudomonadota bacterium]